MTIYFCNNTPLDMRALMIMGLNAKDNVNAIGHFGTGFKYAIAILARMGATVEIKTNGRHFKIDTYQGDFRGKWFEYVRLVEVGETNDEPQVADLPFTTELGKSWQPWMAYRELRCNAEDEHGEVTDSLEVAAKYNTIISVSDIEIERVHKESDKFFINTVPISSNRHIETHKVSAIADGTNIYYRGIKVGNYDKPCLNRYNVLSEMQLTEDRSLVYTFSATSTIIYGLAKSTDSDAIRTALMAPEGFREREFDWDRMSHMEGDKFSTEFKTELRNAVEYNRDKVTFNTIKLYKELFKVDISEHTEMELTDIQRKQWDKAVKIAAAIGYDLDKDRDKVCFVEKMQGHGDQILGAYEPRTAIIYITRRAFQYGTKSLIAAIIEELHHKRSGSSDGDYEMQVAYLMKIVEIYEQHVLKEPI